MDVQPAKTSKCIDYVMILNVCDSIFFIPNSVRSLAPCPWCAHSSKRLRMDPLAADELVSWKIANTAASSSWWHPNPWRNGSSKNGFQQFALAGQFDSRQSDKSWRVWISRWSREGEKMGKMGKYHKNETELMPTQCHNILTCHQLKHAEATESSDACP